MQAFLEVCVYVFIHVCMMVNDTVYVLLHTWDMPRGRARLNVLVVAMQAFLEVCMSVFIHVCMYLCTCE